MRGIRRKIGSRKTGKLPATADIIGQMMAACPDTTIGLRNAALWGIGFAAALRRSELVAIEVADVKFVDGFAC
jgi:integrase